MEFSTRFQPIPVHEQKLADLLEETRWSDDLSWEDVKVLGTYMELFSVAMGTVLFEQGDTEIYMCLLSDGEVTILKEDSEQKQRPLAVIGKDKTFGEMALIDHQPRSATAVASRDSILFVLTRQRFIDLSKAHPRVCNILLMKFAKLMSQRLRETSGVLVDFLEGAVSG